MIHVPHGRRSQRSGMTLIEVVFVLATGTIVLSTIGLCVSIVHRSYDNLVKDSADSRALTSLTIRLRRDTHSASAVPAVSDDSRELSIEAADEVITYQIKDDVVTRIAKGDTNESRVDSWRLGKQSELSWKQDPDSKTVRLMIDATSGVKEVVIAAQANAPKRRQPSE